MAHVPVEGPRRWTHRVVEAAFRRFRPARFRAFQQALGIEAGTRVLDVGGTPYFWKMGAELGLSMPQVTIVNLESPREPLPEGMRWVRADARRLPFADGAFDAVFCNSVIEHLGSRQAQQELVQEIRRVGRGYFVQTPSRRFPVETHFVTLFLHWFPKRVQKKWMLRLSLAGTEGRLPREAFEPFLNDLLLLDARELQALFPEAEMRVERFLGLEKSATVYFSSSSPPRP